MSLLAELRPQSSISGALIPGHEDLPEYNFQPLRSSIVPESWRQEPITVHVQNTVCTFGTFIKGSIQISPHQSFTPIGVNLGIISRERSGRYGEAAPHVLKKTIAVSRVPIDTTLYAGFSYRIPFSIMFPEQDWVDSCKCGKGHDALPPSHGVHRLNIPLKCDSSYALKISLEGYLHNTYRALQFTPTQAKPFESNEITTCYSLKKTLKTKYRVPGRVLAKRFAFRHSGSPVETSKASLKLFYIPHHSTSPPNITEVVYEIVRCVFWSKNPIQSLECPQKQQILKTVKVSTKCDWVENKYTTLEFDFDLSGTQYDLEPTYTGCLTAIRYAIIINVCGVRIIQPLVIGG